MRIIVDKRPTILHECPFVRPNDTQARGIKNEAGETIRLYKRCGLYPDSFSCCKLEAYGECSAQRLVTLEELEEEKKGL